MLAMASLLARLSSVMKGGKARKPGWVLATVPWEDSMVPAGCPPDGGVTEQAGDLPAQPPSCILDA